MWIKVDNKRMSHTKLEMGYYHQTIEAPSKFLEYLPKSNSGTLVLTDSDNLIFPNQTSIGHLSLRGLNKHVEVKAVKCKIDNLSIEGSSLDNIDDIVAKLGADRLAVFDSSLKTFSSKTINSAHFIGCGHLVAIKGLKTRITLEDCAALTTLDVSGCSYISILNCPAINRIPLVTGSLLLKSKVAIKDNPHFIHGGTDDRDYNFYAYKKQEGWRIIAGCRNFSIEEAITHWSVKGVVSNQYSLERVKSMIIKINKMDAAAPDKLVKVGRSSKLQENTALNLENVASNTPV